MDYRDIRVDIMLILKGYPLIGFHTSAQHNVIQADQMDQDNHISFIGKFTKSLNGVAIGLCLLFH